VFRDVTFEFWGRMVRMLRPAKI
jgi:hypothetical protein